LASSSVHSSGSTTPRPSVPAAFKAFIQGRTLTAHQFELIDMMIDHMTASGAMDPRLLYESPFTDIDPLGVAGVFKEGEMGVGSSRRSRKPPVLPYVYLSRSATCRVKCLQDL
jgi:EcoEI R protein C-terminal